MADEKGNGRLPGGRNPLKMKHSIFKILKRGLQEDRRFTKRGLNVPVSLLILK